MATEPDRPLRRDAERNRRRILDAARELVGRHGLAVTHEEIAHAAEVGVGTVYRRFPSKDRLVDALFDERVAEVTALAREASGAEDAYAGLRAFMERTLELQAEDRGLRDLLQGSAHGSALARTAQQQIAPVVGDLVRRAKAAGQLRDGVGTGDMVLVQLMVGAVMDTARASDPRLWRRALALALDGLRPDQPAGRLPGRAPGPSGIEALIADWRPPERRR